MDPRRHRPPLELETNPLVFVLAQVVISPVLQMANYVPRIQEQLRKAGFPRYNKVDTQEIRIRSGEPELSTQTKWVFSDRHNTTGVVIHPNFVVVEQTAYRSFDDFIGPVAAVLEEVGSVIDADLYERIGLRRVNLIEATDSGLSLQDFFKSGLRGLAPEELGVQSMTARLEEKGQTPVGDLIVRLLKPAPEEGLPQDLQTTTLDHKRPNSPTSEHALLDIDHYMVAQNDFTPSAVVDAFWDLHGYSDLAFRAAVTNEALAYWGQKETT